MPWDLDKAKTESSSEVSLVTNQSASESKRLSVVREPSGKDLKTVEDANAVATTTLLSRPSKPEATGPVMTAASVARRSRISELLQTQRNGLSRPFEHEQKTTALQQNLTAMNALMKREKTLNESMKKQLETLAAELAKALGQSPELLLLFLRVNIELDCVLNTAELYNEEKTKNEKITVINRKQKDSVEYTSSYLPGIHAPAVLQQQTQMEISYQRKVWIINLRD